MPMRRIRPISGSRAFPSPSMPSRPTKGNGSRRASPRWTASSGAGSSAGPPSWSGAIPGSENRRCCLQVLEKMAGGGLRSSTVSGEESARQIKLRGKRLGASAKDLLILVEVELENILSRIQEIKPAVAVIDSIQTVYSSDALLRAGERGAGAGGLGKADPHVQEDGHPDLPRRPCDEGRIDRRPQGPGAHGRHGPLLRGGFRPCLPGHPGDQEPLRSHP